MIAHIKGIRKTPLSASASFFGKVDRLFPFSFLFYFISCDFSLKGPVSQKKKFIFFLDFGKKNLFRFGG